MKKKISVATLTYGSRTELLFKNVDRLVLQDFECVYIFCNGISVEDKNKISDRYCQENIYIFFSEVNLGSAGGYYNLLENIINEDDSDYILILDDDNLVSENCVDEIRKINFKSKDLYYFHRPDRLLPKKAKEMNNPELVLGSKNSFLGRDVFTNINSKLNNANGYKGDLLAAPYGGLLLSRSALQTKELPMKELYLYADDYEYTHRLVTKYGYVINFSEAFLIEDLEKSFHLKKGNRVVRNRYSNASDLQLFYSVRNNTWFGLSRCDSKSKYFINMALYTIIFLLQFLLSFRIDKIKLFTKAIRAGFKLNGYIGDK
ncbi:hypothetical protein ACVBKF_01060 [Shewanella sp. 0m-11]